MISSGKPSNCKKMFTDEGIREADVLGHYLGISSIPCVIVSPFRNDTKPSLAFYSPDGSKVNYIDFGDKSDRGSMITFFMKLWNLNYNDTIDKIVKEVVNRTNTTCNISKSDSPITNVVVHHGCKELKCTVREWEDYDIKYWATYGVSLKWLKWADVYPISHKFIIEHLEDGTDKKSCFRADKLAYTYVERKEGRITHKFYQPLNKVGFKWQNSHDKSVLGLWTKMPETGKAVCICSSMKDALCLMSHLYIPCIYVQGEGYSISDTAASELRRRFTDVFICLDNDITGKTDSSKLAESTGFINVIIPPFEGGKDISDYFKIFGEEQFISLFKSLFIEARYNHYNELPF